MGLKEEKWDGERREVETGEGVMGGGGNYKRRKLWE